MKRFSMLLLASTLAFGNHAADLPADVSAQVAKFKDTDPKIRQQALSALGRMGEKAKPAMPQIVAMTGDKVTWVQTKALMVIAEIGPDESVITPVLPFLEKFADVRDLAVEVFVKLKEKGVPALTEALKDDKKAEGACQALAKLGPIGKPATAALTDLSQKGKTKPIKDAATTALRAVSK